MVPLELKLSKSALKALVKTLNELKKAGMENGRLMPDLHLFVIKHALGAASAISSS